jgi:5-methylcytosine-specific restriction endonuclease McrA
MASHKKNPEAIHGAHQAWKRRNPEKNRQDVKAYAVRHPDVIRATNRRSRQVRRGRERTTTGSFTVGQMRLLFASYLNRCAYCPNTATSLDHVVPLARGGSNDIDNLVPACFGCNLRKGARSLLQFMVRS